MEYIIKDNLPAGIINPTGIFSSRLDAHEHFIGLYHHFVINGYNVKVFLRNISDMPLRGQIRVEVDGFYYYVELFIKQ